MAVPNFDSRTLPNILCCMCGIPIPSNPANMCVNCIRNQVDISDGIPKQLMIQFCRGCGRYLNPPSQWTFAELESKELLSLCLKRIKGLNKVKLIDAGFVWTEPHSKRLKVKLTIQKEVFTSTILQQVFVVEFVVTNQQCDACAKFQAKDTWNAVAQVRQKVDHKKTFYFLEQLMIKHNAHANTTNIKEKPDGLDFYYSHKSHAMKMVEFLQAVVPIRCKMSDKLISQDDHSNTYNYKYSFSVELTPICRDDLVCLPTKLARASGNISPLLLCYKVSSQLHFIDPLTLQALEVSSNTFWNYPFRALCTAKSLIQYVIIDISPLPKQNGKYALAEVQLARACDFGSNDTTFYAKTHLGNLLKPGDYALGYDLSTAVFNDDDISAVRDSSAMPDVVLIRKWYGERRKKNRRRHWQLKTLDKEVDEETKPQHIDKQGQDFELFMRDLEEDPELRSQINLFKVPEAAKIFEVNKGDVEEDLVENQEEFPEVKLEELMEELTIDDKSDLAD